MQKTKTQKGITLVALIITIIVLLILAVVAISAVNSTGIINHAQNAADKYEEEKEKENTALQSYMDILDHYNPTGGTTNPSEVAEWGEFQGMLLYIGDATSINLTNSSMIEVETLENVSPADGELTYTRTGTTKTVDIANYTQISCFAGKNLEYVDLGNKLADDAAVMFSGFGLVCSKLKEIKGLGGMTYIDGGYTELSSLISLTIPSTITDMSDADFDGCNSLSTIIIEQADSSVLGEEWIPSTVTDIIYLYAPKYYVYESGSNKDIYALKIVGDNVDVTYYSVENGSLKGSQNFGNFTLSDGSDDVTLTLDDDTTTISEPYKIINIGANTYLKDDKYYIPISQTKYGIATLDPDFDASILVSQN